MHPGRHAVKDTFHHAATDATHGGGGEGEGKVSEVLADQLLAEGAVQCSLVLVALSSG